MTKYSLEFKLKIVTAYMNNEGGYTFLAKKLLITMLKESKKS